MHKILEQMYGDESLSERDPSLLKNPSLLNNPSIMKLKELPTLNTETNSLHVHSIQDRPDRGRNTKDTQASTMANFHIEENM